MTSQPEPPGMTAPLVLRGRTRLPHEKPAAFRPILGHPRSVESSKRDSERGRSRCEDESARGAALPEAKRLGVKGRSKLDKGQLKAAVDRRKYT